MRILIFTNRDLASNYHLNLILPHIRAYVIEIFVSDKVGKPTTTLPPLELRQLKFFEQKLLNEILFPQLDAQNRDLQATYLLTFNELSRKYQIPISSLNEVRSAATLEKLRQLKPNLILSVRYGKIFKDDFIKIPTHGVLNLHSGKLPNYRGVLASFRALANDDKVLKTTLHYISDGNIDNGAIIGFSNLTVEPNKSLLWHILNLYPRSIDLTVSTIRKIAQGETIQTTQQDNQKAQYFTFPTHAEVIDFIGQGWQLYDLDEYSTFIKQYLN
jgi:methionyl-tRNA formyltransferase